MKPTLDADGRLVPREDYRISTLNCGEDDFAVACMRSSLRYGKNQKRKDVKNHHYIISFDPRDGPDNGLTVDKAQELGERFGREQFPGHQAIVCTHPDGHNQSGNIHVHIVINSLRIENVPLLPYMDRPADTKAGCKHLCTDAAMEYFKFEVMELCHEAGLYQIDLLNGSANRVTECEYWAKKKGQAALDRENAALAAEGKPTQPTHFETDKEKLRQIIRKTLNESFTVEDFARKLGDSFDKAAVLAALEQNAARSGGICGQLICLIFICFGQQLYELCRGIDGNWRFAVILCVPRHDAVHAGAHRRLDHHGILKIGNLCRNRLADVKRRSVQQTEQRAELCQNVAGCFVAVGLPVRQVVNVRDGFRRQETFKLPVGAEQENRLCILAERFAALQRVHDDAGIYDSSHIRFSLSSFASSNVTSAGRIPNRDLAISTLS